MKTTGSSFLFSIFIISSVNVSHPLFACDAGLCSSTVSTALSNNTPSFAHGLSKGVKDPLEVPGVRCD